MKIGVTMRIAFAASTGEPRDAVSHDLVSLLAREGHDAVLIPNTVPQISGFAQRAAVAAVILSGGDDLVRENVRADGRNAILARRDDQERELISFALDSGLPLLGICRGLQLLNDYFGGETAPLDPAIHRATSHPVTLEQGLLHELWSDSRAVVNSFHSNGIPAESLAKPLRPLAFADDGSVEAAELPGARVLGVMWHPEREFSDPAARAVQADSFITRVFERLRS